MSSTDCPPVTTRALRFHEYGEPADVLTIDEVVVPEPGPGLIRVAVHAVGLNPADWALCRGLFPGILPRGIGLDVSGVADAVGEGVTDVALGDRVLGSADFVGQNTAGAGDRAILNRWVKAPDGLDLTHAAALPMAVVVAHHNLNALGVTAGRSVLIHGAGTMIGFAAVQLALLRGARVFATAGGTYADDLARLGASVTGYGDGMVERVGELVHGPVDLVLDTAPPSGVLPALIAIAGGDPKHVLTISDFAAAVELGTLNGGPGGDSGAPDPSVLRKIALLAAEGRFRIPIAREFPLDDWRAAMELSMGGHAHGKVMLIP